MDEKQRELATNRLLEVIRSKKTPAETDQPQKKPESESKASAPTEVATKERNIIPRPKITSAMDEIETDVKSPPVVKNNVFNGLATKEAPITKTPSDKTIKTKEVVKEPVEEVSEPQKVAPPNVTEQIKAVLPKFKSTLDNLKGKSLSIPKVSKGVDETNSKAIKYRTVYVLDIGTSSVKIVKLEIANVDSRITAAYKIDIPYIIRKQESNTRMLITKSIREMLPLKALKKAELFLTLPDQASLFRTLNLPFAATKAERENAVKFQIKKELSFPLEHCDIEIRGWNDKIKSSQSVEVLAIDKRSLQLRLDILEEIGMQPSHIITNAATMHTLASITSKASGNSTFAVIDIGAAKTSITVIYRGKLAISRTVSTGSDDFNSVLKGMEVSVEGQEMNDVQIEAFKIKNGMPPENDPNMFRPSILMRPIAERLASEINRSIDFFRRSFPEADLDKIHLIGGGSLMKRLPEFLEQNVGIDMVIGTPDVWSNVIVDNDNFASVNNPLYSPALAVGLDKGADINFIPDHVKIAKKLKKVKQAIPIALISIMIVLITSYTFAVSNKNNSELKVKAIREQLHELPKRRGEYLATVDKLNETVENMMSRQTDFTQIEAGNPEIPNYLRALSHLTPRNVYLSAIHTTFLPEVLKVKKAKAESADEDLPIVSVDQILAGFGKPKTEDDEFDEKKRDVFGRVIELKGIVYPAGNLTDVQLVDYVFKLESSGWFRDVAVDSIHTHGDGKIAFKILCGI